MARIQSKSTVRKSLVSERDGVVCPCCGSGRVYRSLEPNKYVCKRCNQVFNDEKEVF